MIVQRILKTFGLLIAVAFASIALSGCDNTPVVLSGTVSVTGGAPVPNLEVAVFDSTGTTQIASTRTSASGTYEIHASALPDADYKIRFGQASTNQWWENQNSAATATLVTISSAAPVTVSPTLAAGSITGKVTAAGADFEGAYVEAIESPVGAQALVVGHAYSDSKGEYLINELPSGDYVLRVSAAGYATRYVAFADNGVVAPPDAKVYTVNAPGNTNVDGLDLVKESTLTGSVSGGGQPAGGIVVTITEATSGLPVAAATTASDGSFTITGLSDTAYSVTFTDPSNVLADLTLASTVTPPAAGSLDLGDTALVGVDCSPTFVNANLTGIDLSGKSLVGCDFSSSNMTGANFSDANLVGATFSVSTLTSFPNLTNANLTNANLTNANLSKVNLTGANLTGANLNSTQIAADTFDGATLTGATFTSASFNQVNSGGIIGTPASLPTDWELRGGFLLGPKADLRSENLTGLDLSGLNLSSAQLHDATLANTNLNGTDLSLAIFYDSLAPGGGVSSGGVTGTPSAIRTDYLVVDGYIVGPWVDLTGAYMPNANLNGVNLVGANMTNAVMTNADMRYVNFTHTKLQGFDLGNGQLGDNTSGDIQGTPAALPPGWSVSGGYLTYFG